MAPCNRSRAQSMISSNRATRQWPNSISLQGVIIKYSRSAEQLRILITAIPFVWNTYQRRFSIGIWIEICGSDDYFLRTIWYVCILTVNYLFGKLKAIIHLNYFSDKSKWRNSCLYKSYLSPFSWYPLWHRHMAREILRNITIKVLIFISRVNTTKREKSLSRQ